MDLIQKLKILMEENNIKKISELSRQADIPYTTLKSIFDGDVNDIRLSTSRKLCDFFNITLDELLDDDISLDNISKNNFNIKTENDLTEEELEELERYKEFLKSKRKNK